MPVFSDLALPNGSMIPNRIAKAAMEENMADAQHAPSTALIRLYRAWADGGAGLLISGNVMIDRRAMTGPGGVVLEDDRQLERFRVWAATGRARGAQFWLQLNHPGRQVMKNLEQETIAPSAVSLDLGSFSKLFAAPRAMREDEIHEVIERFARSARLAQDAGFSGVQVHAAHGYLLSQFLSPLTNQRRDRWGGSLENRARLLIEVVKAVRASVSASFSVAVKLNSADFQRGGFDAAEAGRVLAWLNDYAVDLVELSGGSYEAPAMQGEARDGRTLAREAYFLEFAKDLAAVATMPLMVTGGIRRLEVVRQVLDSGIAMAGIGTALAQQPSLPDRWRDGLNETAAPRPILWKSKPLAALASMAVVKYQLRRLSKGQRTDPAVAPIKALLIDQVRTAWLTRHYKRWMVQRAV